MFWKTEPRCKLDESQKINLKKRDRFCREDSVRGRPRKRSREQSQAELQCGRPRRGVRSMMALKPTDICPPEKKRKLNCLSYLRVIGRQSKSSPNNGLNGADPKIQNHSDLSTLSLSEVSEPPPLALTLSGDQSTTSTGYASSENDQASSNRIQSPTSGCTLHCFSDDEDIDLDPSYRRRTNPQRKERTLNGYDVFAFGGGITNFDMDRFSDRLDGFQLGGGTTSD